MTIKLLVISTAKNTNDILEDVQKIAGEDLEIVLHLGSKSAHYKASSMSRLLPTNGTRGHVMSDNQYSGLARELIQSDDYFRQRDVFSDHLNRTSEPFKYKSHPLKTQQDFHDYHHILVDTLAQKVKESGATHCLFFNVPHLAYDTALYQVAKMLGLKITIVTQSIIPNRFFSMEDPADYGNFQIDPEAKPYEIEKGSLPDLFYMKGIKQEREEGGRITARAVAELVAFLATKRPLQAFNPFYIWKTLTHMREVYGNFPKWRDPFARFFHEDEFAYFDHIAGFEDQKVDLSGDFVYFALHLQPEMTTSSLGERFRDQAYAIERLAEILPEGVRILVKENPKQGGYMRGPLFFHRLKRIPSVTFLPSWADTHALIGASKFVATITGTVGWEAVRMGKPVLVFGNAWYRTLPGATKFSDNVSYQDILGSAPDHDDLQQAAGSLVERAHVGVVDRHYSKLVPDFEYSENSSTVAESIWALMNEQRATSFAG